MSTLQLSTEDQLLLMNLSKGKGNVAPSHWLADQLCVGQRTIGFAVSRLRKLGYPIGSIHGEGYYLIETEEELEETIAHIEARKAGIDLTIAAIRSAFEGSHDPAH